MERLTLTWLYYGSSIFLGAAGAWAVLFFAPKLGLLDYPTYRSSHTDPTPKGGGVGILAAWVFSALWLNIPPAIWAPASAVSFVSLLGDYREISVWIRLAVQLGSAAIVVGFVFLAQLSLERSLVLSVLICIGGVLYITATANCFNFMDGINGIAGLTGTIAFILLGAFGFLEGKYPVSTVAAFGIAGACSGFLPFNYPRARVFMGDVGSVLLGFLFASWALWLSGSFLEFAVFVSFLFPFYVDEFNTQLTRLKGRERITDPHCRHIYQILVHKAGLSHGITTAVYGFIQVLVAIFAWILMKEGLFAVSGLLALFFGILFFGARHIRRRWETE